MAEDPFYCKETNEGALYPITWIRRKDEESVDIEVWDENTTQLTQIGDCSGGEYDVTATWSGKEETLHLSMIEAGESLGDGWINMAFDVMSILFPRYRYSFSSFGKKKEMITFVYNK